MVVAEAHGGEESRISTLSQPSLLSTISAWLQTLSRRIPIWN